MKLIIEIKRRDDKWETHECNDFANWSSDFVTLYKEGFKREMIRTDTIVEAKAYFKQ